LVSYALSEGVGGGEGRGENGGEEKRKRRSVKTTLMHMNSKLDIFFPFV
jgi:hypothetical protein